MESDEDLNLLSYQLFSLQKSLKTLEEQKKELIEKIKFKMMELDTDDFDDSYGNSLRYITKTQTKLDKDGLRMRLGDDVFETFVQKKEIKVLMPYSKEMKEMQKKYFKGVKKNERYDEKIS